MHARTHAHTHTHSGAITTMEATMEAPQALRGPRHPVVCVSWSQARRFANWVGGDLPTESEWMYAAQSGGGGHLYPWGQHRASCEYAVMHSRRGPGCGEGRSFEVCSHTLGNSEQGLCDLAGNAWEWVLDEGLSSGGSLHAPQFNPDGSPSCLSENCSEGEHPHIARGGGWGSGAKFLETTSRVAFDAERRHPFLGFRPILRE